MKMPRQKEKIMIEIMMIVETFISSLKIKQERTLRTM